MNINKKLSYIFEPSGVQSRLLAMEGVRAFAVVAVFFVHYLSNTSVKIYGINFDELSFNEITNSFIRIQYFLYTSHWAVDVFFLLSGFLIYKLTAKDSFSFFHFIYKRLLRIYPAFTAATGIVILYQSYYGRFQFELSQFLANLLFLQGIRGLGVHAYSSVTWSLFYEFSFYLSFPLIILLLKKLGIAVTNTTIVALGGGTSILLIYIDPFYIRFLMFFAGVFMALYKTDVLKTQSQAISDTSVVILFFLSVLVFSYTQNFLHFIPVFLFTAYLFVLKAVFGDGWLNQIFSITPIRYLGNISYSFYLLHGLCINFLIWKVGFLFNWTLKIPYIGDLVYLLSTFTACFMVSTLVAMISFILFERPYFIRK